MWDPEAIKESLERLKRVEGQVKGVLKMVEEERYCVDILHQLSAIQGALDQVSKLLIKQHLESCVADAFKSGSRQKRGKKVEELMEVFARFGR